MISRGDVYSVDLGQPVGHEPGFLRPAIVVSVDTLNNGPGGLVLVVPVGSADYGLRSHVELEPSQNGLTHTSYARCDQVRAISVKRLVTRRGLIAPDQRLAIDLALRFVLDL